MQHKRLKCILIIASILGLFVSPSFAQGVAECTEGAKVANDILVFLSRARAGFAVIAGKLMTNEFVVGGAFHIDVYLYKIHNIMRNFANFALGFFLLYVILKSFFSAEDGVGAIGKKIVGLLVAGILIQASWFIVLAVVDISTVLTASVGSLPSVFIAQDNDFSDQASTAYAQLKQSKNHIFNLNAENTEEMYIVEDSDSPDATDAAMRDFFLPSNKTLSGPLIYLGASILGFTRANPSSDVINTCEALFIDVFLDLGVIVMYAIALLLLTIVNVIRVGMLWMLLALAPLFFLVRGLQWGGAIKNGPKIMSDKGFTFKAFVQLIFVPVKVVLVLSMLLIFLTSVWNILKTGDSGALEQYGVECTSTVGANGEEVCVFANTTIVTKGDVVGNSNDGGLTDNLSQIIVVLFTLFGMWMLIKLTISQGSGFKFIDNITEGWVNKMSELAKAAPIVPVAGGSLSVNGLKSVGTKGSTKALQSVFGAQATNINNIDYKGTDKFNTYLNKRLVVAQSMGQEAKNKLASAAKLNSSATVDSYIGTAREVREDGDRNEAVNMKGVFGQNFGNMLWNNRDNKSRMLGTEFNHDIDMKDVSDGATMLTAFLKTPRNATTLHNKILAAGFERTSGRSSVINYNDIANNEYRNKKEQ